MRADDSAIASAIRDRGLAGFRCRGEIVTPILIMTARGWQSIAEQ
jgi:hypothetical protein